MAQHSKSYIGDGVYIEFDGFAYTLTTENGVSVTNTIVMEPEVITNLKKYIGSVEHECKCASGGCL